MRLVAFLLIGLIAAPAIAADRSFSVTGFDRIRVDGPFRVRLATGSAPYARASGSASAIDSLSIRVEGRTLIIRSSPSAWGGYPDDRQGPVEIAVGTHDLGAAFVNGAGSLSIDRVRGLRFDLSVHGSGSAEVDRVEVDRLAVALSGAASARLSGRAADLQTTVRGTSVLDAAPLEAKDAKIGVEGPSEVTVRARGTAEVDASGVATVSLAGNPACKLRQSGSARVLGCGGTGRSW